MPYRRLPTTDLARKKAMEKALEMGSLKIPAELSFSQPTLEKLRAIYPAFEKALTRYRQNIELQEEKNGEYDLLIQKARVYLSHFVQVFNLAVAREEIAPEAREFFGFGKDDDFIPPLNLESEILSWGEKIIYGEQNRIRNGGNPIYSPSIALVKVHYDAFRDAVNLQKTLQSETLNSLERVAKMRDAVDNLIHNLWDEVELHYQFLSPKNKRQKSVDYGVVYIFRQNEATLLDSEKLQTEFVFGM
jgi:hypothetical protein